MRRPFDQLKPGDARQQALDTIVDRHVGCETEMPVRETGGAGSKVTLIVIKLPLMDAVTGTTVAVVTGAVVTGTEAVGIDPCGIVIAAGTVRIAALPLTRLMTAGPSGHGMNGHAPGYRSAAVYR